MRISTIKELIKFVVKSGASEVTYEEKEFKLTIKSPGKNSEQHVLVQQQIPSMQAPAQIPAFPSEEKKVSPKKESSASSSEEQKFITIKSPMIGTFYRSSAPDKPHFVNAGDEIRKGQTLCIIEAMKLFNEIESEYAGKIIKVLVEDASPVEYDQPLFLIEPK